MKEIIWFFLVNVAFNKPAWQSKPYISNKTFHANNAVDGLKSDLSAWGGQCCVSADRQRTATWWVNLTSIYSIHDIRIYYRTDNSVWNASNGYTERFLGFYVFVSNTTSPRDGYLCFQDTIYNKSTIPAVANITCTVHGQYVIYYNERLPNVTYTDEFSDYAHNELCEVEVYGCTTGYYGRICSSPCPDNCRYCHIETGECSWCEPGYQGFQCEQSNISIKNCYVCWSHVRVADTDRIVDSYVELVSIINNVITSTVHVFEAVMLDIKGIFSVQMESLEITVNRIAITTVGYEIDVTERLGNAWADVKLDLRDFNAKMRLYV
ncbi:uncharacterized protein LOC133203115 [Saccostrea echinata]|uniref:uncharacterized protein LOC133203115 n=1 Tax=Saccostrea echinata TaxID=191078 RepID=UPI002A80F85A|nr:uncharacterized protein LOC133203115 [Saccostrea echinata]